MRGEIPGRGGTREAVRPLVVLSKGRSVIAVGTISEKARRKSVEQGELWWLHPGTDRVLPFPDGGLLSIDDRGEWVEATVEGAGATESDGKGSREALGGSGVAPVELAELAALIRTRREERPEGSYTTYLFEQGGAKIRKKLGEEAIELVLAATRAELVSEAADLIYHLLVLLESEEIPWSAILGELSGRHG